MIELTRFDGSRFFVNVEFIEFVEPTPDTVVSLIDHKKLLVRESASEVVERIMAYHASLSGRGSTSLIRLLRRLDDAEHDASSASSDGEDRG
jgi:flagellar protein FlbD